MVATLSTRLAAATELTPELREEMARLLGWRKTDRISSVFGRNHWQQGDIIATGVWGLPKLDLTEIVAEIERRNWPSRHESHIDVVHGRNLCAFDVFNGSEIHKATRPDRNIQLCAMTALAMALENDEA